MMLKEIRESTAGVTLIEIIIVLVIIGLAAGLTGVLVGRGSKSLEIKTFTKDVSAVLRFARNRAAAEKRIYCFVIDGDEGMYRLYAEDTDYTNIENVLGKQIPGTMEMNVRDRDEDAQYIEFFPQGNSTGGIIEISGENGSGYYLSINRITGKLEVVKIE